MYVIKQLDFAHLSSAVLKDYQKMLDPRHWRYLKSQSDKNIICFGITKDDVPVGIASGEIFEDLTFLKRSPKRGEIYQIYLQEQHTHIQLIEDLMDELEKFFKNSGCFIVNLFTDESKALQSVLNKRGWNGPRPYVAHYIFDAPSFMPQWFTQMLETPLTEGYTIFKWKDIKKSEWEAVKLQETNHVFPPEISPFHVYSGPIETQNSLGLKHQDEVIGWMITHRLKDSLRYTSLFIQPAFQKKGLSIKLLAEAIKLQQKGSITKASMEIYFRKIDSSWLHFIEKYLEPYAESQSKEFEYWLDLKGKEGT